MLFDSAKDLSRFYTDLAELLHGGSHVVQSLRLLRSHQKPKTQQNISRIISQIERGSTLHLALKKLSALPKTDLPLLQAGEESGKLVAVLKKLSGWHETRAKFFHAIQQGLIKPSVTIAAALFLLPLPRYFQGKLTLSAYLTQSLGVLLLGFGIIYLVLFLIRKSQDNDSVIRSQFAFWNHVPFFNTLIQEFSMWSFCSTTALLVDAGIPLLKALRFQLESTQNQKMANALNLLVLDLDQGRDLALVVQNLHYFDKDVRRALVLGSQSGALPEGLHRVEEGLESKIQNKIGLMGRVIPAIVYALVLFFALLGILDFYQERFQEIDHILEQ